MYIKNGENVMIGADNARLTDVFKRGLLRLWEIEDIPESNIMRYAEAYLMMAGAKYRPQAPSDGCGDY